MYYLPAILLGLVALSMLSLRMRPIRLPPVHGTIFGRAAFIHRCAIVNFQKLLEDFNAGIHKQKGGSVAVIYPEWIRECVAYSPVSSIPGVTNTLPKGWRRI